ncbi:MAG TPA: arginase family protein [Polyangiaceae bacterium]|nr:arginase family protein [Polyangiaceae bacterium]
MSARRPSKAKLSKRLAPESESSRARSRGTPKSVPGSHRSRELEATTSPSLPTSARTAESRRLRPGGLEAPRASGVPSLLRLPVHDDPRHVPAVDILLCGVPFDGGAVLRSGARFGPRAVREASAASSAFSSALGVDIFEELRAADGGDVPAFPHDQTAALEAVAERAEALTRSGVIAAFVGGDQTITLGALRGIHRAKHKAVSLLHIDAHSNASGKMGGRELHAMSVIRHAVEEGLVRPDSTLQVGIRGPFPASDDLAFAFSHGFEVVTVDEVRWDLHAVVSQVRRLVRKGAIYVSVDIAALDPAFAPGAGFPVPGGMSTWELQQLLRALVGAEIVGFDVVEITPAHDHAGLSALAGVTIVQEILAALADTRRSARPAPSTHRALGRPGRRSA